MVTPNRSTSSRIHSGRRTLGPKGRATQAWLPHATRKIRELETALAERDQEIDELKIALAESQASATVDSLTGCPNRLQLDRDLTTAINRFLHDPDRQGSLIVSFIDLDLFKQANDAHGHGVGDRKLTEFAKKLKSGLREGDTVYRLGGDEFVIVAQTTDPIHYLRNRLRPIQRESQAFLETKNWRDLFNAQASYAQANTSFSIGHAVLNQRFIARHFKDREISSLSAQDVMERLLDIADQSMLRQKGRRKALYNVPQRGEELAPQPTA